MVNKLERKLHRQAAICAQQIDFTPYDGKTVVFPFDYNGVMNLATYSPSMKRIVQIEYPVSKKGTIVRGIGFFCDESDIEQRTIRFYGTPS